ncbi:hypothetical protein Tco_0174474 [Tanacetum coccineum]
MSNMSEDIQYAGSDTRPPMLDRTDYESWQQRIRLYCLGKDNEENIMKSINEHNEHNKSKKYSHKSKSKNTNIEVHIYLLHVNLDHFFEADQMEFILDSDPDRIDIHEVQRDAENDVQQLRFVDF